MNDLFPIFACALLVAICCKGKAFAYSTSCEVIALLIGHWHYPARVSFCGYYLVKLVTSVAFFLVRRNGHHPKLQYVMGFESDKAHAGIVVGDKFFHFAHPRGRQKDVDSVTKLEARRDDVKVAKTATLQANCGYAVSPQIADNEILQLLRTCGKCHNWALITIYEISAHKFLSLTILSPFRWDVWILLFAIAVSSLADFSLAGADAMADWGFMGIAIYDSFNMNKERLFWNRAQGVQVTERIRLPVLLMTWVAYVRWCQPYLIHSTVEFMLTLLIAITTTLCMTGSQMLNWRNN